MRGIAMNTYISRLRFLCAAAGFVAVGGTANAADYIYRDLMGNTLAPPKCAAQTDAAAKATDPYTIKKYAKKFCETQGYGWYVAEQKSQGTLVCNECEDAGSSGKVQCHLQDVVVSCKRLKPGSVGLFPGKS